VVSIGDYVLSGGELPVMVMLDAIARWIPGVLGHDASAQNDSFSEEEFRFIRLSTLYTSCAVRGHECATGIIARAITKPYTSGVESKHLDKRGYIEKIYSKIGFR